MEHLFAGIYNRVGDVCMDEGISKVRGEEKTPSASMKNQIKSLFNLLLDYALEYELVDRNYSRTLNAETWDDLLDIVNLRNMIVHNNGQVDKRFESTSTFRRWKDRVDIPLIKIEDEDIAKLLSSVIDAVTIISNLYLKEYYQRRNRVIANYYFNKENAYDFFADTE